MTNYRMQTGLFLIIVLAFIAVGCQSRKANDELRPILEKSYSSFLSACRSGDEETVKTNVAAASFTRMQNHYKSIKKPLTSKVFKGWVENHEDLSQFTFTKVFHKGDTAGLLYTKDFKMDGKAMVTFAFIKFVREGDRWRFYSRMDEDMNRVGVDGSKAVFALKSLPATLAIDGIVPQVPSSVKAVGVVGMLDVVSYGYHTLVFINDVKQADVTGKSISGVIQGGLKSGKNKIKIIADATGDKRDFTPEVTVRTQRAGKYIDKVFSFTPKSNAEGTHQFVFSVK